MQLQDMRVFIQDYIGETVIGFRTNNQLNNWCNGAYRKIARARSDWNWLTVTRSLSLEKDVADYQLPADLAQIKEVRINDAVWLAVNLHEVPFYEGNYFYVKGTNQGDRYIHLLTPPDQDGDQNLVMTYQFAPPMMTDDTDAPLFPEIFHDIIPTFVCYLALRKEDDPTKEEFLKEYSDGFKKLLAWDRQNGAAGYKAPDRLLPFHEATNMQLYREMY